MLRTTLLALILACCSTGSSSALSPATPQQIKHSDALAALSFLEGAWVGKTAFYQTDGKTVNNETRVSARVGRMDREPFLTIALRDGELVDLNGKSTPPDTFAHKDFEHDFNPRTPPSPFPRMASTSISLLGYHIERGYERASIGSFGSGGFPVEPVSLSSPGVISWSEKATSSGSVYRTTITVKGDEWIARTEYVESNRPATLFKLTTMKRVAKAVVWEAPRLAKPGETKD